MLSPTSRNEGDDEFGLEDSPEGISYISTLMLRHKTDILAFVLILVVSVSVYLIFATPVEMYRAYGDIVRIDEVGFTVSITSHTYNGSPTDVPSDIMVSSGICHLNPDFGYHHCRIGSHVELISYITAFRQFWYLNSITGDLSQDVRKEKT